MRHSLRRFHGFTLVEVMLATAIMAMLALTLFASMRVAFRARDKALAQIGPARAAELAMDLVRRDLESALPPSGTISREFLGQSGPEMPATSAVRFYSIGSPPDIEASSNSYRGSSRTAQTDPISAGGGIERIDLLVRPSGSPIDGGVLVRRVVRNVLATTEPTPEEEVLCRGVTGFHIRYFDGFQWYDEWDSTQYDNALPLAVEVSLVLMRPRDPTRAVAAVTDVQNLAEYRSSRTFLLPCRDEAVLTGGGQ